MKYGTKKLQRRATEIVNHRYHRFKFQDCYRLKLIVFFVSQFYAWKGQIVRHNKFLLQYRYFERIENNNYDFFCKATLQYFQSILESYVLTGRFKSSYYCNIYQYSIIITVDTKNVTINEAVFVNYRHRCLTE